MHGEHRLAQKGSALLHFRKLHAEDGGGRRDIEGCMNVKVIRSQIDRLNSLTLRSS